MIRPLKTLTVIFLIAISGLFFSGCDSNGAGSTDPTTTSSVLPTSFSVEIPDSLMASSSSRSSTRALSGTASDDYTMVMTEIQMVTSLFGNIGLIMAEGEYAISQNSLSLSDTAVSSVKITATQDFLDTMEDLLLDAGISQTEIDNMGFSNYLNQSFTVTNFCYKSITDTTFDYELSWTEGDDEVALYWSSDLLKLKYVFWSDYSDDTDTQLAEEFVKLENSFYYDGSEDEMTFVLYQEGIGDTYDNDGNCTALDTSFKSYDQFRMSADESGLYVGEYDLSSDESNPAAALYIYADDNGAMATDTEDTATTVAFDTGGTTMTDSSSYSTKLSSAATTLSSVKSLLAANAPE